MTHITKSGVVSAIYTVFSDVTAYWERPPGALETLLSIAQLPPRPNAAEVEAFLRKADLLDWRLAVDGKGVWQGQQTAAEFIGVDTPFWAVDCWQDDLYPMDPKPVVDLILSLAEAH